MRAPTFEKKSQTNIFLLLFRLFLSEIMSRGCQVEVVNSCKQQAILLKKWKISVQND